MYHCGRAGCSAEAHNLGLVRIDTHSRYHFGEVAEWFKAPVSKTGDPQGSVDSNSTLSASGGDSPPTASSAERIACTRHQCRHSSSGLERRFDMAEVPDSSSGVGTRRDGRVVYRSSLLNCWPGNRSAGSNPAPSSGRLAEWQGTGLEPPSHAQACAVSITASSASVGGRTASGTSLLSWVTWVQPPPGAPVGCVAQLVE